MNTGFVTPIIEDTDFVLGSLEQTVLQPDGQWMKHIPDPERQLRQFETSNCVVFNTYNCLEMLFKRQGKTENFSDRFGGMVAGTYPPGNDPNTVIQSVRHSGCIPEAMMPFAEDLKNVDEYYSFKGVNEHDCVNKGMAWLKSWNVGHEWLVGSPTDMMYALRFSPLGASVQAWERQGDVYVRNGVDTHWTCIIGYQEGKYWIVYDSYLQDGSPIKFLAWDFGFRYVKRYSLTEKSVTQAELKLFERILFFLKELVKKYT